MFPTLQAKLARYEEIERLLQDPDVLANTSQMLELQKEHGGLGKVARSVKEFNELEADLATAQEMLDAESGKYLAATAGQPHILPSIFRIPKISAQMKFGLRVDKEQQLNLVFFSTRDQTQSQNEQAIDFEIASVPAPPGAAQQLIQTGPSLDLVLDPLLHAKLVSLILQAPATDPDIGPLVTAAGDPKLAPRIVALTVVAAPDKAPRHLLFHATTAAEKAVGLWLLTHPAQGAPTLETIYKFTTANGKSEKIIRDIILELGDRLEKLFS